MNLAVLILTIASPFAHAHLGASDIKLAGQIYLNRITISNVVCIPGGSRIKLADHGGPKDTFDIEYSECRKISNNRNYTEAAICSQLEGNLVVEVTDSALGTFPIKHVSEIRSLSIVQRACQ